MGFWLQTWQKGIKAQTIQIIYKSCVGMRGLKWQWDKCMLVITQVFHCVQQRILFWSERQNPATYVHWGTEGRQRSY